MRAVIASENSFMIKGLFSYELFGQEVWITTTHVALLIVFLAIVLFAVLAHRKITKNPDEVPGTFQNIVELIVEKLDGVILGNLGTYGGVKMKNYICTIFIFILLSNIAGIFGLRSPTADYGVTLLLGLVTFVLIHFNGIKVKKIHHFDGLLEPVPLFLPVNIISELAVPVSLSLRLFGNVMSGTVMLGLWYSLIPWIAKIVASPFLHVYFDLFSGAIQAYVFSMLTMVYIRSNVE